MPILALVLTARVADQSRSHCQTAIRTRHKYCRGKRSYYPSSLHVYTGVSASVYLGIIFLCLFLLEGKPQADDAHGEDDGINNGPDVHNDHG